MKLDAVSNLDDLIITTTQAADLVEMTPQHVQRLAREGVFSKVSTGRFRLAEVVRGYVHYLKDEARQSSKSAAASRLADARAAQIEQRILREARVLVYAEEAEQVQTEFVAAFLRELDSLPARLTRDLKERDAVRREVVAMRDRMAAKFERMAKAKEAPADEEPDQD